MIPRIWTMVGIALLANVPVAFADSSLAATGSVGMGYTDNIQGGPDNPVEPNRPLPEADGFMDLTPGILAGYDAIRGIHSVRYMLNARLLASNSEANSVTNTLLYQGLISMSRLSTLRLLAGLNSGRINGFHTDIEGVAGTEVLPEGGGGFTNLNATAAYRRLLSVDWTTELSLTTNYFRPDGQGVTDINTLTPAFSLEREFRFHLLALDLESSLTSMFASEGMHDGSLTAAAELRWVWDISETLSSQMSGGVDVVGEAPTLARGAVTPRGSIAFSYQHERGSATVGCGRSTTSNVFTGDLIRNSDCNVNLGLPVPYLRNVTASGTVGYGRGKIFDLGRGTDRGYTRRFNAYLTFAYRINDAWNVGLRFEDSRQVVNDENRGGTDVRTNRVAGTMVVSGRFPEKIIQPVPRQNNTRVGSGNRAINEPAGGHLPGDSEELR